MKRRFVSLVALFLFAAVNMSCTVKFIINHKGKIIEINAESWADHQAHGDTFVDWYVKD